MSFTIIPAEPIDGEGILPITAALAHLRLDDGDETPMVEALTIAAIDWVERHCSLALAPRSFIYLGTSFPRGQLRLPFGPVNSIETVEYLDGNGAYQALLSPGDWRAIANGVASASDEGWPVVATGPESIKVQFTAGYTSAAAEAPALISAVKLLLGNLYLFREEAITGVSVSQIPMGVTRLCESYRMPVL